MTVPIIKRNYPYTKKFQKRANSTLLFGKPNNYLRGNKTNIFWETEQKLAGEIRKGVPTLPQFNLI